MRDIVIKSKNIKREIVVFVVCFVVVNLLNVYAICSYDGAWRELYSVWYAILGVSVLLYLVLIPFRVLFKFIARKIR